MNAKIFGAKENESLSKDFVLLVNGHAQYYPFHYYHKDFCTPKLIKRYEKELNV